MNTVQKIRILTSKVFSILLFSAFLFSAYSFAAGEISLKVYEGYRFSDRTLVKSDDKSADISFYVNRGRANAFSFALGAVGANRIKEFGKDKPDVTKITLAECAKWDRSVNAPSPGYYVILSADGKSLYLIKVSSFQNQGKAASFWKLNFSYTKVG